MTDNRVMHKRQLVDEVARRSGPWGLTRRQVRDALHGILDVITDEMSEGNAVTIAGFGRFEAKEHKSRRVVGLDGEEYEVESRLVPSFHPYDSLRQKVQEKTNVGDTSTFASRALLSYNVSVVHWPPARQAGEERCRRSTST